MNVRAAQVTLKYDRELVKIAIAMGASVGLAYFVFTISAILDYPDIAFLGGSFLFFIQQVMIMTSYISSKKIVGLC